MGLEKSHIVQGIPCTYACIIGMRMDTIRHSTEVNLGIYFNKEARDTNIENHLTVVVFYFPELDLTRELAYGLITKPRPSTCLDTDGVTQIPFEKNPWASAIAVYEEGQRGYKSPVVPPPITEVVTKKTRVKKK